MDSHQNCNYYPVTHVIFDLDGLLLNTESKYEFAINTICEKYGSHYTAEAKSHTIGRSEKDGAEAVIKYCNLPINVSQLIKEIDKEYEIVFKQVDFMPGAENLIKYLFKNNIPFAIATSGKLINFKRKTLNYEDIFKLFSHIVFGSEDKKVKNGKPAPDIFQITAKRFKVQPQDPRNVLVFEDSNAGVKGGLAAGMQVVWVPDPTINTTEQDCTILLTSLEEFQPELFGMPKF